MVDPAEMAGGAASSDEELRSEPSRRDHRAALDIRQIVLDHYQSVFRYAFRLSGAVEDAEDLTQQTFLLAQSKLYQVREPEKVDRWLFAILRSCYLKGHRRQRPIPARSLELNVDEIPEDTVRQLQREDVDAERLQQAIDELPDEFKLVLLMFYFEQLSYKEIAAKLEIKMGTVMSRLSRAKGWLRRCLVSLERRATTKERSRAFSPAPASPKATRG